ncbi:unnamed protein product, partial [Closterium sp. NIES-54]
MCQEHTHPRLTEDITWRQRRRLRQNEKQSPLHSASSTSTANSSTPSASTSSSRVPSSSASSSRVDSSSASSSSASSAPASSSSASSARVSSSNSSSSSAASASASCSSASNSSASSVSASSSFASSARVSRSSSSSSSASNASVSSSRVYSSSASNTTSPGSSSISSTSTSRTSSSSSNSSTSKTSSSSTSKTSSSSTSSSSASSGRASSSCSSTRAAAAVREAPAGEEPAGPPADAVPLGSAPPDSAPSDSAPPGSAPSGSIPPGSAPPGSAPPESAPLDSAPPGSAPSPSAPRGSTLAGSAPPDSAPLDVAPLAAPESTATSAGTVPGTSRPASFAYATTATTTAATATAPATATVATAAIAPDCCIAMASLPVLAFDPEGRPVQFDTCLDDLQLYLLSDIKDGVSLFDHVSGATTAPPTTADGATRSLWLSHDAAARLAICNHLALAECAHFGQHRTAQALYDAVVTHYSSPAIAALGRLLLPYLFPELSAFATVEDMVSHLCASDARYHTAVPAEFLDKNPPPMFITLYFIVTRLPDSLLSVKDHFLSLDPTSLTIDLLEQHLLAGETSAIAVGAARGTPRPPFFEGCSPSPLAPSYASAAAVDVSVAENVGAASASAKRRSGKGKGGKGGGGGSGGGGGGIGSSGGGSSGGGGGSGTGGGSGSSGGGSGGSGGSGGGGGSGTGGGGTGAQRVGSGGGQRQQQQRRSETQSPQIAIFDLDFYAILSAMYALSVSAEGDCYRCVPPHPGIAASALGASESRTLPGTAPAQALHTFTLDSGASACFIRDSTTLTPLSTPVPVRLADPSGGPVVACFSTVLSCPAVPSGSLSGLHLPLFSANLVSTAALQDAMVTTTTPGGQHVTICTCTRTGRHLATFTRRPGSSLYTLTTEPPQVAAFAQVSALGQVAASCSSRLLSHQTLLWHHRLGHPSLPCLRGMHSRLLVSGLPRSLPPLPTSPALPCLPCIEGRQRAVPHSSSFPPKTAPLQTLHMDV